MTTLGTGLTDSFDDLLIILQTQYMGLCEYRHPYLSCRLLNVYLCVKERPQSLSFSWQRSGQPWTKH